MKSDDVKRAVWVLVYVCVVLTSLQFQSELTSAVGWPDAPAMPRNILDIREFMLIQHTNDDGTRCQAESPGAQRLLQNVDAERVHSMRAGETEGRPCHPVPRNGERLGTCRGA